MSKTDPPSPAERRQCYIRILLRCCRPLVERAKRVDPEKADAIYRNYRRNLKSYTYFRE